MSYSKILVFLVVGSILAFSFLGLWLQGARAGDVTNCQARSVNCRHPSQPSNCDASCNVYCDDKVVCDGQSGACEDAGYKTYKNGYEGAD